MGDSAFFGSVFERISTDRGFISFYSSKYILGVNYLSFDIGVAMFDFSSSFPTVVVVYLDCYSIKEKVEGAFLTLLQ